MAVGASAGVAAGSPELRARRHVGLIHVSDRRGQERGARRVRRRTQKKSSEDDVFLSKLACQPKLEIGRKQPTLALRATVGNLRGDLERRLVDGRRLELPASALRTNGGSGRISLSVRDVNAASPRIRSEA
jgi:hypothetical protein